MRIGFDAKRAFNNPAGLGNYSRLLLNALMRYYPGNDYLLYTPGAREEFFHQLQGDFRMRMPESKLARSFHPFWRSYGITSQLQHERVNIYHGLSNELPFNIHRSGIPSVVTIHDLIFLKHTEQYPLIDRLGYGIKTKYAARNASKIIAVSNETKKDLMQFYGIPDAKIEVIYQSVSEAFYRTADEASRQVVRSRYSLPARYILNVGSFFPRKNQKVLLEAFAAIKDKIEEQVVLIGSQGNKAEVEQFIQQRGIQDRVKILTQVPNDDLPAIYQCASLFVFPSLYEGFGIPVLEALASRVPVIASNAESIQEAGGGSSVYINQGSAEEIGDAMLKLLNSTPLREQMMATGYTHALTMNDKALAEKTMNVFESLL